MIDAKAEIYVYLNTTNNTKLHMNTQSHFTYDAMVKWYSIYLDPLLEGITAESTVPATGLIEKDSILIENGSLIFGQV